MKKIKLYEDFVTENSGEVLKTKPGKWVKVDPRKHKELSGEFFDLINIAYSTIGGHVKIKTPEDVFGDTKWTFWQGVDLHGSPDLDVILWGSDTKFGVKFSGVGHDGMKDSTKEYLVHTSNVLKKSGYYIEVSGKLADIMMDKYNVPSIDVQEDVEKLLKGKDIEWHGEHPENKSLSGNGWYTRMLGGSPHTKILIGNPKI